MYNYGGCIKLRNIEQFLKISHAAVSAGCVKTYNLQTVRLTYRCDLQASCLAQERGFTSIHTEQSSAVQNNSNLAHALSSAARIQVALQYNIRATCQPSSIMQEAPSSDAGRRFRPMTALSSHSG
jgi:hypothetical protein